jgi:hypothetical protein
MMNKEAIFGYAKGLAVGNGTLTEAMNDRLINGDIALATQIMEQRKADLRSGAVPLFPPVSPDAIETMVDSIDEAITDLASYNDVSLESDVDDDLEDEEIAFPNDTDMYGDQIHTEEDETLSAKEMDDAERRSGQREPD